VEIVVGWPPSDDEGYADPASLEQAGITIRRLNWDNQTHLKGVLHSKFFVVDNAVAYVGSANFDWRSLAQVKELGLVIRNCSALVDDLMLIFKQYAYLAVPNYIPKQWDVSVWPQVTRKNS